MKLVALFLVIGCKPLTPPPVLPIHAATAPDDKGTTTVMIVFGTADQFLFGGDGWGAALRVEQQETTRTTIGFELTGGRGDQSRYEDGTLFRHWLVGVRSYSRFAPVADSPAALLSGVGVSWTASGLVTGTLDAGAAFSYDIGVVPVVAIGTSLAVPLVHGRAYDEVSTEINIGPREPTPPDMRAPVEHEHFRVPHTELYFWGGLGMLVPLGDTGNRLSGDVSLAVPMLSNGALLSLTVGDAQRFK